MSGKRYYQVFLAAGDVSGLGSKEYIAAKRRLGKDDLVAAALGVLLPPTYYDEKRRLLEEASFLSLDTLLLSGSVLTDFFSEFPLPHPNQSPRPLTRFMPNSTVSVLPLSPRKALFCARRRKSQKKNSLRHRAV